MVFDIHKVNSSHVETVCLLSKLHEAKHHVNVRLDMDELDITSSESKAIYEEIKKYVAEHNGYDDRGILESIKNAKGEK